MAECTHPSGFFRRTCPHCGANKRALNTESSTDVLTRAGVPFESKNNGAHLIVGRAPGPVVDFWPSTGQWIARGGAWRRGRGVFNLLRRLGVRRG